MHAWSWTSFSFRFYLYQLGKVQNPNNFEKVRCITLHGCGILESRPDRNSLQRGGNGRDMGFTKTKNKQTTPPRNNSLQYSKCPQFHKRYLLCHELTGNHPQILKMRLELYRSLNKIWRKLNVASHLKWRPLWISSRQMNTWAEHEVTMVLIKKEE